MKKIKMIMVVATLLPVVPAMAGAAIRASDMDSYDLARGETVYRAHCASCHGSGIMSAPKPNVAADWNPRTANGMVDIVRNALKGKNAMPSKGGAGSLSIAEVSDAVAYMVRGLATAK